MRSTARSVPEGNSRTPPVKPGTGLVRKRSFEVTRRARGGFERREGERRGDFLTASRSSGGGPGGWGLLSRSWQGRPRYRGATAGGFRKPGLYHFHLRPPGYRQRGDRFIALAGVRSPAPWNLIPRCDSGGWLSKRSTQPQRPRVPCPDCWPFAGSARHPGCGSPSRVRSGDCSLPRPPGRALCRAGGARRSRLVPPPAGQVSGYRRPRVKGCYLW